MPQSCSYRRYVSLVAPCSICTLVMSGNSCRNLLYYYLFFLFLLLMLVRLYCPYEFDVAPFHAQQSYVTLLILVLQCWRSIQRYGRAFPSRSHQNACNDNTCYGSYLSVRELFISVVVLPGMPHRAPFREYLEVFANTQFRLFSNVHHQGCLIYIVIYQNLLPF